MPAVVNWDTIQDSEIDLQLTTTSRFVRGATVTGIDVTATSDQEALFKIITALGVTLGQPLSATRTNYILQRIVARGFTGDGGRVQAVYETPNFGGLPPSAWLVRRRGYATQASTKFLLWNPGTPLTIPQITISGRIIPADTPAQNVFVPMRAVNLSALIYGALPASITDYTCYANDATWQGLPRGYWLLSEYGYDVSRYAGYYTASVTALSRVLKDWSEWSMLIDKHTGNAAAVPGADLTALAGYTYNPGIDAGASGGVIRAQHYPVTSYSSIFGF